MADADPPPVIEAVELVDCGDGRRLDRLGRHLADRPAPVAREPRSAPAAWSAADVRFERDGGDRPRWHGPGSAAGPWPVDVGGVTMELRLAAGGQVGIFLEQVAIWEVVRRCLADSGASKVLNLFAYTGGTTLVAAACGARVVHVDASRTAVAWARRNADLSGMADAQVRWLVDDVEAFVRREGRRGRAYDLVVLDPPSFGRAGRRSWVLEERLPGLLGACAALLDVSGRILLSAHTPGYGADRLATETAAAITAGTRQAEGDGGRAGREARILETGQLDLRAASGAVLPAGAYALVAAG